MLAAQLNELEDGVAPTDTRLRPDQRLMEEGLWTEANKEKVRYVYDINLFIIFIIIIKAFFL